MEDSTKANEESVILSNKSAVENLRKEKYDHAIFFLNQALLATKGMKESPAKSNLLAMTYNNLGCYLKRLNKLPQALEYFFKSTELSKKHEINIANVTCSHLNISKIFSEQGNHELSLRHALKSLFLLRHNFANKHTLVSSLIIAYQTVGLEYKYLSQMTDSQECFETGLNLSMRHLGRNHEVTLALRKSLQELEGKSARSQSHQSKKREHVRGRSAGMNKVPSKVIEAKAPVFNQQAGQMEKKNQIKDRILRRIGRNEIRAAVVIQRWWRKVGIKIRWRNKNLAAAKIQKWWRWLRHKRIRLERLRSKVNEREKSRPRSVKRHVIKKGRANGPSADQTKAMVNERERGLAAGTNQILKEVKMLEKAANSNTRTGEEPFGDKASFDKNYRKNAEPVLNGRVGAADRQHARIEENKEVKPGKGEKGKDGEDLVKNQESHKKIKVLPQVVKETEKKSVKVEEAKVENDLKHSNEENQKPNNHKIRESVPESRLPPRLPTPTKSPDPKPQIKPILKEQAKERIQTESSNTSQDRSVKSSNSRRNYLKNRRADISHQINSLIKIQCFMRMVPARLRYLKQRRSICKIQAFFRGIRIKRLFAAIRDAVIFIQYMYRKYRSRYNV